MAGSRRQFKEEGIQLGVEATCNGIKFGQGGLKTVLNSHGSFVWRRVVWVVVVEGGSFVRRVAAMKASYGEC